MPRMSLTNANLTKEPAEVAAPKHRMWVKVDPLLQRTAWILSITLVALTLISNYVVPHYQYFLVAPQFLIVAWYLYKWKTQEGFLAGWYMQYGLWVQVALCLFQSSIYLRVADGDVYIKTLAILWILVGCSWFAMTALAAHENQKAVWNAISDFSNTQSRLIDLVRDIAETQGLIIEKDGLEKRLAEVQKEKERVEPSDQLPIHSL
jgi:hypothetical protein